MMFGRRDGNCASADVMLTGTIEAMHAAASAELPFSKTSRRLTPCREDLSVGRLVISLPRKLRSLWKLRPHSPASGRGSILEFVADPGRDRVVAQILLQSDRPEIQDGD